jgi:hypothetical protein
MAINLAKINFEKTIQDSESLCITNDADKLSLYKTTNKFRCSPQFISSKRNGRVSSFTIDTILQIQMCLLLDPYYEAKYNENLFSFRKGRNPLQAVALLEKIIGTYGKNQLGIALTFIKPDFNSIPYFIIQKYFIVPSF